MIMLSQSVTLTIRMISVNGERETRYNIDQMKKSGIKTR